MPFNGRQPPFLVYANAYDYKIFNQDNAPELKPDYLEEVIRDIGMHHKTTENLLRAANNTYELCNLCDPDFNQIYWKEPPAYVNEAKKAMGIKSIMNIKEIQSAISEMHSLNLRGNEYTQVQQRVEAFRKHVGTAYSIHSEIITNDGKTVLSKASITDKDGRVVAEGLAEELRGSSNVNKTSPIENCETSAWGRALANLGLHGGKMASVEEIQIAKKQR